MATSFSVIYLGNFADLDPVEGNSTTEDAALLVGSTFGSGASPLSQDIRTLSPVGSPGTHYNNDGGAGDQYSIDGTTYTHDGFADYTALVTFADGTTAEVPVNIFQSTTGELFLAPSISGEEDIQALMDSQPITSLEVLSMDNNTSNFAVDRLASNFADSTVDGTSGNDNMTLGYSDADGTEINAQDNTINGGDGNDYIEGAGGDDLIDGGTGGDAIFGDMADGSSQGRLNVSVTDNLVDSGGTEAFQSRAVELVTLSNGDLIMITSERGASTDGIASYRIDNDPTSPSYGQIIGGQIDTLTEAANGNGFDAINDMASATLADGSTYVFTADGDTDTIGVARVNLDGSLTELSEFTSGADLDQVQELSVVEVGGQPVLLALGGGVSDSLVSFTINPDGSLTQADIANDMTEGLETFIEGGNGDQTSFLESFTNSAGQTFVVAGSSDFSGGGNDGISLFSLDATGQLTWQNGRANEDAGTGDTDTEGTDLSRDVVSPADTGLNDANAGAFTEIDGQTYFFVGGNQDDVDVFRVDVDTVNNDGTFYLTLVGHVDDVVTDISSMNILETEDGPVLVVGGEQNSLEFHSIAVDDTTGEVSLSLVDTVTDGAGGATELADSESIDVEGGILVSASDNDDGVTLIDTGLNPEAQAAGSDTIDAGAGDDLVMGGAGDDSIIGDTGNDTLYGDGGVDRNSLNWEDYSSQQLRDGFTDSIGGIDVTFSSPVETGVNLGVNNSLPQYTGGIDSGGAPIDSNSAMGATLSNTSSRGEYGWDFSQPVTNVSFNINDLDAGEQIQIFAYDTSGNPIEVILTPGSNVSASDTDSDGVDDLASGSGSGSVADASQSVTVTIPGPVASIEAIHTLTSGGGIGITFTEMFFDVRTDTGGSGNDTIDGGDGSDLIYGGAGDDSIAGGIGDDTITGDGLVAVDGSELLTNGTFDGNLNGWTIVNPTGGGAPSYSSGGDYVQINAGNETAGGDGIEQDFATTSGGVYDISVDLGQNGSGSGTHTVLVEVLDSTGTVIASETQDISQGETGTVDLSFTAVDATSTLRITNPSSTSSISTDVTVIGASAVQTAEPAASGNDSIDGGSGNDLIDGGLGNDTLTSGTGNDTLYGGAGNDSLTGGDGHDSLDGGTGDDTIRLEGNFSSNDTVVGGDGIDELQLFPDDGRNLSVDMSAGAVGDGLPGGQFFSEIENVTTGAGDDTITGDTGDNVLKGGAGDDSIDGGAGDDSIEAGEGSDTIFGGAGADTIDGGDDYDVISYWNSSAVNIDLTDGSAETGGEAQGDVISNVEEIDGSNTGDDTITVNDDVQYFWGHGGNDSLTGSATAQGIGGGSGDDFIDGGGGSDTLWGDTGADTLAGGSGADSIEGGTGLDYGDYSASDAGVTVDLGAGTGSGGHAEGDTLTGVDGLIGSSFDDVLTGYNVEGVPGPDYYTNIFYGGAGSDTLDGAGGSDELYGETGDDSLIGGTGDDSLDGGLGSDTIALTDSFGNDTIVGGEDSGGLDVDVLDASGVTTGGLNIGFIGDEQGNVNLGADNASFSEIESFVLSAQDDTLDASGTSAPITVEGGDGADLITGSAGDDSISGGDGDGDNIIGGAGADTLDGGAGGGDTADYRSSGAGVTVDLAAGTGLGGDAEGDVLSGFEWVQGSNFDDSLTGDGGDNILAGNAGSDTLVGGGGDDYLVGGTGNDSLTGGAGDDTFSYAPGDGLDTISDFNAGNSGTLSDGDNTNNDFIDLSAFYDSVFELQDDYADDGVLNQSNAGNTVKGQTVSYGDNSQFGTGEGIVFTGQTADGSSFTSENTGVVCFTSGTLIRVPGGEVPIETLRVGDKVITRDNGVKPILWIGTRTITKAQLRAAPALRPVRIFAGQFGFERDLVVSPQHGVLLRSSERGGTETLFRARHLARIPGGGVRVLNGAGAVTYIHILFDQHEIVFGNGVASESLYPGPLALGGMSRDAQQELCAIFPQLGGAHASHAFGAPARSYSARKHWPEHLGALRLAS